MPEPLKIPSEAELGLLVAGCTYTSQDGAVIIAVSKPELARLIDSLRLLLAEHGAVDDYPKWRECYAAVERALRKTDP